MILRKDIAPIGKFLKTHALKGELNAVLDIDAEFITLDTPLILDIDGIFVPFYCEGIRQKGTHASLVKLDGIDSEEDARTFVNKEIYALKDALEEYEDEMGEEDEEGAYADALVGYRIIDEEAGEIGEITDFYMAGDNPLFVVTTDSGDEIFIPVADEFISEINDEQGIVTANLPTGLTDINKKD